jgi:hypothetical protein
MQKNPSYSITVHQSLQGRRHDGRRSTKKKTAVTPRIDIPRPPITIPQFEQSCPERKLSNLTATDRVQVFTNHY